MAPSASITRTEETQQNATLSRRPCQLEFSGDRPKMGTRHARCKVPDRRTILGAGRVDGFWRGHRKTDDVSFAVTS